MKKEKVNVSQFRRSLFIFMMRIGLKGLNTIISRTDLPYPYLPPQQLEAPQPSLVLPSWLPFWVLLLLLREHLKLLKLLGY